jgi:prophage regulatory protein
MAKTFLRLEQIQLRTGLPRSTIYYRMSRGEFPKSFKIGGAGRAVAWLEEEIEAWQTDTVLNRQFSPSASDDKAR